jgi:hypothetical protein
MAKAASASAIAAFGSPTLMLVTARLQSTIIVTGCVFGRGLSAEE